MDYKLTEGSELSYCDAPTIASTLRSKYNDGIKERPIVLISTLDNIVNIYRKDYTSHDLFDYAISKSIRESRTFQKKMFILFKFLYKYHTK